MGDDLGSMFQQFVCDGKEDCVNGSDVQLGGRWCCWHGQWMYLVCVTGSVVGLAVFLVCVLHTIFKERVSLYVRFYVYVMLFYV